MTLLQLIETLKTQNVNVTVVDADTDTEIISFKASGIAGVEGDVSARTVRRWELIGATAIRVVLEAA
jgi:hypothetical protein